RNAAQDRVRKAIEMYYRSIEDEKETSLRRRLVRAGFFDERAATAFNVIRFGGALFAFLAIVLLMPGFAPSIRYSRILFLGVGASALAFILPNFILDHL